MIIYKFSAKLKLIRLAVLVFLQKCYRCGYQGLVKLYDDETARVCSDFTQQIELEVTGRVKNPI